MKQNFFLTFWRATPPVWNWMVHRTVVMVMHQFMFVRADLLRKMFYKTFPVHFTAFTSALLYRFDCRTIAVYKEAFFHQQIPSIPCSEGGNLSLILTHHSPKCSVAALMPHYHHCYSSRVAGPIAEEGAQWWALMCVHMIWASNGRKSTGERAHAEGSPSWAWQPADVLEEPRGVGEITSVSGTTAGVCSNTVCSKNTM